jgi:hypothetical protein
MPKQVIGTWKAAQALVPAILEKLNSDPALMLAALTNPLLALEDLGYEIAPSFREELTDRVRFKPRDSVRVRKLREAVFAHTGRFDVESPVETERVLFGQLKLRRPPYTAGQLALQAPAYRSRLEPQRDPLESLRGQHAAVDALLELRRLDASAPRLAPRDLYDRVKAGRHSLPVTRIRARLKARDTRQEG